MALPSAESYFDAYRLLMADFQHLWSYVEPTDGNLATHSHRLFELLLRACTEFESLCKELCVHQGIASGGKDYSVYDFVKLELRYPCDAVSVELVFWKPSPRVVRPFHGWTKNHPPLAWYQRYNDVKHNRLARFSDASLLNVTDAISGLYVMLLRSGSFGDHALSWVTDEVGGVEHTRYWVNRQIGQFPLQMIEPT